MNLEGRTTRLRALEPGDIELMYAWENDTEIWGVSGTLAPFSRHTLERFIEEQQFDIFQTRQQRLIIETPEGLPVGALDLFDLDPVNLRAGVGILIHDTAQHHAAPQVGDQQILAQPRIQGHQIPRIEDDRERKRMGCGNAHPQQDHRHLMNLEGRTTRLRALEPGDIELMYAWENDTEIWGVSGTLAPFSRHTLERFIEEQQFDIFQTRQQRLIIETPEGLPVGALDLFDLDPVNLRAGVGILIHDTAQRGKGYAADAVETVCSYARDMLHLHQLWCSVEAGNAASLALFRHAGFSETGIRKEWLRLADGFHDEVFLQKIL